MIGDQKIQVSIIILNWNGRDLLEAHLSSVKEAVASTPVRSEIIIVDNGSTDGSTAFVETHFPEMRILKIDENLGFGEGNNCGASIARGEILVFLNNDMLVEVNFLNPLLKPFAEDGKVFAVASQIFFQDEKQRREETGKTFLYWERGVVRALHQMISPSEFCEHYIPIHWAGGGASAFRKEMFTMLGGFRSQYSPAYVEDTDISYRALKMGWKVYLATDSIVHHKHRASTSRRFTKNEIASLVLRNELFFIWSNITDSRYLLEHLLLLPLTILLRCWREKSVWPLVTLLSSSSHVLTARKMLHKEKRNFIHSDRYFLGSNDWKKEFLLSKQRPSILIVSPYVPGVGRHGGGVAMFQVMKGLAASYDVSLLSYYADQEEYESGEFLRSFCLEIILVPRKREKGPIDWFHRKPQQVIREFNDEEMREELWQAAASGKYDVIQLEYLEMAHWATMLRRFNIPLIFMHHEVQYSALKRKYRQTPSGLSKVELFWSWMKTLSYELSICELFDRIIVVTGDDQRALTDYNTSLPVQVIPAGVDLQYYEQNNQNAQQEHSLIFIGNFRHFPNEDAMLHFSKEILPRIIEKIPDVTLHIVGADPTHAITNLHDGKTIIVHGRVEDIRPHIASASLFIAPLRYGAGMRLKILEAWAMKKGVITTTLGAAGIGARDGKNIMIADSPTQFASVVVELLEDQQRCTLLGENGFKTAKGFDWSHNVAARNAMLRSLLQEESA